jgi:hypothetical protein
LTTAKQNKTIELHEFVLKKTLRSSKSRKSAMIGQKGGWGRGMEECAGAGLKKDWLCIKHGTRALFLSHLTLIFFSPTLMLLQRISIQTLFFPLHAPDDVVGVTTIDEQHIEKWQWQA